MKFLLLLIVYNLYSVYSFFEPYYKGVGKWYLRGTSNIKHQNSNIYISIMPKYNDTNLSIEWIKKKSLGPVIIKDIVQGEIKISECNDLMCMSNYNFEAENFTKTLVTIFGISIPSIIKFEQPINDVCNKEIKWSMENDFLLLRMYDNDYIFSKDLCNENISLIRLDHFIITQLLGYIFFKSIDKLHIL
jgi:hypothetical protein